MSGVKHTPVLIATSSAADGVYVISQGEERKAIGTIRAPRSLVDTMCAAPDLLEALEQLLGNAELARFHLTATEEGMLVGSALFDTIQQARAAIARARGEQDGGVE